MHARIKLVLYLSLCQYYVNISFTAQLVFMCFMFFPRQYFILYLHVIFKCFTCVAVLKNRICWIEIHFYSLVTSCNFTPTSFPLHHFFIFFPSHISWFSFHLSPPASLWICRIFPRSPTMLSAFFYPHSHWEFPLCVCVNCSPSLFSISILTFISCFILYLHMHFNLCFFYLCMGGRNDLSLCVLHVKFERKIILGLRKARRGER